MQNTTSLSVPIFPCDALGCGGGLYATGQSATISVVGSSHVFDNPSGPGVRVDAEGSVTVNGDGVEIYGNAAGVAVGGVGSTAFVHGGTIRNNDGPSLRATSGARIDVLRPLVWGGGTGSLAATPVYPVRLYDNQGGLYATGTGKQVGGVISSETAFNCTQSPCPTQPIGHHDFQRNNGTTTDTVFDASAHAGSQVLATYNYWGTSNRALVQTDDDGSSLVSIDPILQTAPSAGASGSSGRGTWPNSA